MGTRTGDGAYPAVGVQVNKEVCNEGKGGHLTDAVQTLIWLGTAASHRLWQQRQPHLCSATSTAAAAETQSIASTSCASMGTDHHEVLG